MHVSRRHLLRTTRTAIAGAGVTALAGCSTFTEPAHILTVTNETDSQQSVTVTVFEATDGTTSQPTNASQSSNATTGTSTRFVVDFQYDVDPGSTHDAPNVLPKSGTYEVVATVDDVGTARTTYTDTESVRVTITDGGVTVQTYTPE